MDRPDPEEVRRALAEIDAAWTAFRSVKSPIGNPAASAMAAAYLATCSQYSDVITAAARAWLAQQDGEASDAT